MGIRSCGFASPLHLFLLVLAPLAVSPSPLGEVAVRRTMQPVSVQTEAQGAQRTPLSVASASAAPLVTPELSADQGSNLKNLPSLLWLRDGGTPITTFDDGLVLEEFSGVATNPPTPTRPAVNTIQNSPSAPTQEIQFQTLAVPNLSGHQTIAGSGNTNTITTLPSPSTNPAALPGAANSETVPTSSLNINGTPGRESSAVSRTTALTLVPFVSVITTVDSNGRTRTTSAVFSSTSALTNASTDASTEQVDHHSPDNESPSGSNPSLFSQPATAAGVIVAAVIATLALCAVIVLIIRHRKQQKRGELQSIHSNSDYAYPSHRRPDSGSSFSASRRHSFRSDRSSTFQWHAHARAELEAMSEANRTAVSYSAPPANNGAPPVAPTGKDLARLSAMQEAGTLSPFADHATAPATEPVLTLLTPFPQRATSVPSTYVVDVPHQQHAPLLPTDNGLVPLVRAPPLRMRSRSSATRQSTLPAPSTPSGSLPIPPPPSRARSTSAPGGSWQPPPRWNDLPLLKRTPQLQSAPSLTGSTSRRNPFTDRPSRPSTAEENEKVLQERLSNPFADADSISEDGVAVANEHASYFPDFNLPELECDLGLGLGLGLGSSRASIEDVLGHNERLLTYTDRVDVRTSVLTIMENGRRPSDRGVVVPIVTVQAPSNEDGISLLSSEADPTEMTQSLDEEHLFYKGGPRAHASLTAVGVGRK